MQYTVTVPIETYTDSWILFEYVLVKPISVTNIGEQKTVTYESVIVDEDYVTTYVLPGGELKEITIKAGEYHPPFVN